jgi:hypothetical protein
MKKRKLTPKHSQRGALLAVSASHRPGEPEDAKTTGLQSQTMDFRTCVFWFGSSQPGKLILCPGLTERQIRCLREEWGHQTPELRVEAGERTSAGQDYDQSLIPGLANLVCKSSRATLLVQRYQAGHSLFHGQRLLPPMVYSVSAQVLDRRSQRYSPRGRGSVSTLRMFGRTRHCRVLPMSQV